MQKVQVMFSEKQPKKFGISRAHRPGHAKNKVYAIFKVGSLEIEKGEW